ncbi:hypothetical protein [Methylomonas koyamae]|uniref:hypothetical protein n=1 Tax=Methylomonas koyamae TaxID=702114 RepID=UPI00112CC1CD|nr:hypothetical protein [Methylomonas koyamae]TPQ24935.1 hypothetical protein C2U68_17305 [Methylomonas koyamae]
MTYQELFNIAITLAGILGGWILKTVWESIKDLQKADREIFDKIHELDKVVAGDYVRKDYLERIVDALFRKLDSMNDKLDGKVDK